MVGQLIDLFGVSGVRLCPSLLFCAGMIKKVFPQHNQIGSLKSVYNILPNFYGGPQKPGNHFCC